MRTLFYHAQKSVSEWNIHCKVVHGLGARVGVGGAELHRMPSESDLLSIRIAFCDVFEWKVFGSVEIG